MLTLSAMYDRGYPVPAVVNSYAVSPSPETTTRYSPGTFALNVIPPVPFMILTPSGSYIDRIAKPSGDVSDTS